MKWLCLFWVLLAAAECVQAEESPLIRVLLASDVRSARIELTGPYRVSAYPSRRELVRSGESCSGEVTLYREGIVLAGRHIPCSEVYISSSQPAGISINNSRYRGDLRIVRQANGRMMLVNHLDVESYLRGISIREVSHYWPKEALKVHAVVFRTYAAYQMRQNARQPYDLSDDVSSQVYGGVAAERYRMSDAVAETSGEIMIFQGQTVPAFFHSTCGGHTEDASVLWKTDLPPLKGVLCPWCRSSPHFSWKKILSANQIEQALRSSEYGVRGLNSLEVARRSASGRAEILRIQADSGERFVPAKVLRQLLGPNTLRSTLFTVLKRKGRFIFSGTGWGHGVGMCQWGAYFMARSGFSCREILHYYYPGAGIETF